MNTPLPIQESAAPVNPSILVVEDSATQAEAMKCLLEESGYQVTTAANGELALAAAHRHPPAVVISDVLMPVMDGFTFCRALKQDPALRAVPVVLLTSLTDPQDIVRGLTAQADYYLTKPYDPAHLLGRIEFLLAHPANGTGPSQRLEVAVGDENIVIESDPQRILNLLVATYEQTVQQNRKLTAAERELREFNEDLEARVVERTTKLTAEIAERRRVEAERERLIDELRAALTQVKTLTGLVPICAGCKKIRDDKNYWHQVESYISEHTDAKFSHGMCPDCISIYCPGMEAV